MSIDWASGHAHKCRARIHEIEPLLELSGTWKQTDIDDLDSRESHKIIMKLKQIGAIEVATTETTSGGKYVQSYRWNPGYKESYQEYADELNRLPCGCRAHIPPGDRGAPEGQMCCKHCGQPHEKETIRECL